MNRYQIIKVDINEVEETCDLIEARQMLSMAKRDIEERGYVNFQIIFRVLDDNALEKLAEVHQFENKQWTSLVITQDNLEPKIMPSESVKPKEDMSIEKIYFRAKFESRKPKIELTTLTYLDCDKQVNTCWTASFNDDALEVTKEEYEFLLKELEVAK